MNYLTKILISFGLIVFAYVNAQISDSVSNYQLNAVYFCSIEATEKEHRAQCRNELDGFGFITVLPADGQDYLEHFKNMHR